MVLWRNRWIAAESRAKHLERLSDTERHDLRKELKKLRYSVEFLAPFYPAEPVAAFQKQLKPLQADLGAWNDAATAKRLVDSEFAQDLTDPGALAEVANVVEALLAKAAQSLSDAEKHWTRLKSLPKPWA